jgi:hypothetical protein
MANVDLLEPFWPGGTAGVQRWPVNTAIAPGEMDSAPTAAVDYAGALIFVPGATGVADTLDVCLKDSSDAYVLQSLTAPRSRVVDTGGAYATPIVITAADSGRVYLLDDAAGLDFTLPEITASNIGMRFGFRLITEVTSNAYRITAGAAADLYVGLVTMYDKDVAEGSTEALLQIFRPDVSDDVILTIAGTDDTTGALAGGYLEFEAVTAARWFVTGSLVGDGSLATIFS